MYQLKQRLLQLNIFEDNAYLDLYCNLIENNINTQNIKFKTNKHHIIPVYYFEYNNLNVDNSTENLVNLLYKDHILAHYYLAMCSKLAGDRSRNVLAIRYLLKGKTLADFDIANIDLNNYQKLYEESRYHALKNAHTLEVNKKVMVTTASTKAKQSKQTKVLVKAKKSKKNPEAKNKKLSDYACTRTGNKNAFYGKKHTQQTKDLIGELNGRPVAMLDPLTGDVLKTFRSMQAAAQYLCNNNYTTNKQADSRIKNVCDSYNGIYMYKAYGFSWKYIEKV